MRGGKKHNLPTMTEIMISYLTDKREPATVNELATIVKDRRPDLHAKDFGASIRSELQTCGKFERVSRGLYGLKS